MIRSPYWVALMVSLLCAGLYVAGLASPAVDNLLAYRRSAISEGSGGD
ncbi:membrane protein [Shewanella putrefaciens]|nr:membrane protein [Shewanella putrefaciens]